MKLADYVAAFLHERGIREVFAVTGGAVAHLIDAVGNHPDMTYICPIHEQAGAMAVDGYVRITGRPGAAMATTGPGVVNLMTGIANLYYDSLPGFFLAGQVSRPRLMRNAPGVRQLGFQESPHIDMVAPITKYAVLVDDPANIRYELEKAWHLSLSGRPGPVFVEICDDVQRADIDPEALRAYVPPPEREADDSRLQAQIDEALSLLAEAERPVLVLGAAARIAGVEDQARELIERLNIPFALTWAAADIVDQDHPLNVGGFGISASRRGNFAVQNADFVLSVGSRLDTHATGSPIDTFARAARKVIVELDPAELEKFRLQNMRVDVPICADIRDFLRVMARSYNRVRTRDLTPWRQRIAAWAEEFPAVEDDFRSQEDAVNPYHFLDVLSDRAAEDAVIVTDCGSNLIQTFQAFRPRVGQRVVSAFNNSPMGYSLAGAIGACIGNGRRDVICIIGDGGLQVNLQELLTVRRYDLPIKIFLFNNHGYGIIQQTQEDWFDARYHASRPESGLSDPDYTAIAAAMEIPALRILDHEGLAERIDEVLAMDGPVLCDLNFRDSQRIIPFAKAGRPIEDAKPLLDRERFRRNMIVDPLPVSEDMKD